MIVIGCYVCCIEKQVGEYQYDVDDSIDCYCLWYGDVVVEYFLQYGGWWGFEIV